MRPNRKYRAVAAIILLAGSAALGDGMYKAGVAFPANPTIPSQRALIAWRNGSETLIVESTYQTPSPNVGWILPLSAQPTKLEQADPGLLPSLSMCLRRKSPLAWAKWFTWSSLSRAHLCSCWPPS